MSRRYHWEHDGGEFYVVDTMPESCDTRRIDHPEGPGCFTRSERKRWCVQKAAELNEKFESGLAGSPVDGDTCSQGANND